jgi:hypothetical protein
MRRVHTVRSCERVTVTKVVAVEGSGDHDGDPVRHVTYFYDDDGWLIARRDGWVESQAQADESTGQL